jgi:hypothetical protein
MATLGETSGVKPFGCPREFLKELEAVLELRLVWLQKPFLVEELRTQLSDIFGLGLRFKRNGVDA